MFSIFFFQAEDGIRDKLVTGVQTCALPIFVLEELRRPELRRRIRKVFALPAAELVVEDARAAEPAQVRDRLDVVVGGAGTAVADDHGREGRAAVELADDAIPGLVAVPQEAAFVDVD